MSAYTFDVTEKRSRNMLIGRIYGVMFIGILITAVIASGLGMMFSYLIFGTIDASKIFYSDVEVTLKSNSAAVALLVTLIVTAITLVILAFVIQFIFLKGKRSLTIPMVLYCSLMGVLLSELVVFLPWEILGVSFLITAGTFGIMYLIATLSKGSLNALGIIGIGLFIGAGLIALVGWILALTGALGSAMNLYWIVSFLTFAAIIFITIWDMWRIKQIAQSGEASNNLVLYCAFTLYVDFIYIFLRVVRIVAYIYAKNK